MVKQNYEERVMQLSACCAIQARVLELYDGYYDNSAMLEEVGVRVTKAFRKSKKSGLKSLEKISKKLGQRISSFEEKRPDIASSEEAMGLMILLKREKTEYSELSNS